MTNDLSIALAELQLDPGNVDARRRLAERAGASDPADVARSLADARRWHREHGSLELCVELLDLELSLTPTPPRRADLLHEKGRLLDAELLQSEPALSCFQQAVSEVPGHAAATEALSQLALISQNWQPIAARYLQGADEAADKQLAASLTTSAAELVLKYKREQQEGEALLRKSLALDPRNRSAGGHLERILSREGRSEELLALYVARAEHAESREARAAAEVAAGQVAAQLGRAVVGLEHFRRALASDPAEPRALRTVADLLTEQGNWPELIKVFEAALKASRRGDADVALLVQIGMLLWKQMSKPDDAELYFRRVRKIEPANQAALDFYREYHTARNELPQFLAVLAQAQKSESDPEKRVHIGIEMARAAEQRPGNVEKVIDIWKGLLRLRPHLPEAVQSLHRLYTQTQKWNALLELLKDDLDALPADAVDEKVARHLEIAGIYRDHLNLDVMVVNTYMSILTLKPDHPVALAALADRYEAQGRWSDLIQVLTRQAEGSTDAAQRVALYRRVATLWVEKFGKSQNALNALEKILEAEPDNVDARERLKELYAKGRAWRPLLEVYKKELPSIADAATRRARLGEMARIAADRLSDGREAIALWNQALEIAPDDGEALQALATLYDHERRWAALAEVLRRQERALSAADTQGALALLDRLGSLLYEKLGAAAASVDVWKRVQTLDPRNARAIRALREIYAQLGDFEALEALYAEQGAFEELCDTLTSVADRTADVALRTRLLERVAALSLERLQQPDRALKAYERIMATDPQNRAAALALVPLYRDSEKWPRLLATYEILLGYVPGSECVFSADDAKSVLRECRAVCEQRLGSKALALQWGARAYQLDPTDEEVVGDLERLSVESDEWAQLTALFSARLAGGAGPDERLSLLRRLLRIWLGRLYRPADARQTAEAILAVAPGDEEAETALEQIFTQGQSWAELREVLVRREGRAADAAERLRSLTRLAQLEEEKLGDIQAAAGRLQAMSELEPGNERTLRWLGRLRETLEDWPGLVEVLRRESSVRSASGEKAETLLRIAELQETRLQDAEATFETLRDVLALDQLSTGAIAGLERLQAAGSPHALEIASLLLPAYERAENNAKLAATLEVLASAAADDPTRIELLERLLRLYCDVLKDAPASYRVALRLFELQPASRVHRETLMQLALEPAQVEEVAARMRAIVDSSQDAELRRALLVEMAELYESRLGRVQEAESVYSEVLKVDSTHAGAFRALARLYRDTERWSQLRALIEERQALVLNPAERLDLLMQVAEIDETVLEDLDHAVATYQRMLELEPSDRRAHRALDRHYTARERWQELEELLAQQMTFVDAAEIPELLQRRAEIRSGRFGDVEGAVDLLEELLSRNPQHEAARRLLERQLAYPEHKRRVARILSPVYQAAGAWSRLIGALEIEGEFVQGHEAAEVLARIADLQENRLQARSPALQTWRQVLAADPGHPDALTEIERLAATLDQHQTLVDVYQELAFRREPSDIAGRAELLGKAARLLQTKLKNRRGAVEVWKLVLNLDLNNLETARPAAAALEKLYTEIGDNAALAKILHQQSVWADDDDQRCALLFRAAELEEKFLKDIPVAVGTLRSILEIDSHNARVLDELERIFESGGQHKARIEVLRRRIALSDALEARQALRRRIAEIFDRELHDLDESVATCIAILDESPEDVAALDALAGLYERQNRHVDRLSALERRLPLTGDDRAARVEILRQIGGLLAGPLANPPEALERWREILELHPGDPGAIASLEQLLGEGIDPSLRLQAAQALEPVYETGGRWADLARVVQIYIDSEDDARARSAYLVRLATLRETRLGDLNGAFDATAAAVHDVLGEPSLGALLDNVERIGGTSRMADIVALYREIGPDVLDEGLRMRIERTVADQARRLGQTDVAIEYQRRLLDRVPDDASALTALEEIYRERDDAESLYDILSRRTELCADPQEERRLRMQMGELAEKRLNRPEDAVVAYERVLELYPGDSDAAECLDRIYTARERWSDLVGLLERQLRTGISEREAVVVRYRLAELHVSKLHDNEAALVQLRGVLDAYREHAGAIAMLEVMLEDVAVQGSAAELLDPVYVGRQDWASLIKIDEIRLRQADDPSRRLAWTQRIARLYEEQMEDLESALKWYGKVFQELPSERSSLEQLLRLAEVLGRWPDVGQLLSAYLANEFGESDDVLNVVRCAAETFDHRLGDRAEARKYYRRLVDSRPDGAELAALFENALERWEAWQELRELLDERAGRAADAVEKKALMRRSARLDEERLNDRARAIETLKSVLLEDPADRDEPTTASELERLLRLESRWYDLAELLTSLLDHCETPMERDAVNYRLAEVLEKRLEDLGGAVDRYSEILQGNPRHAEAVASMERLLGDSGQRSRVAVALEPVYRGMQDWPKLVGVLEAQLETVQEPAERIRILGEVAELQQRLARLDLAFDARARAWLTDVSAPETLASMESLAMSARAHGPLVQTLQKGAESTGDLDLQAELQSMAARLLEAQLNNPTLAIEAWRAALNARPDLDEAFVALERLLESAARTSELVEVMDDHLGVTSAPDQRKSLARRMAGLYENALKQRERAIASWQTVLEIDDADAEALDALAQLFNASLAWRDLAGILQRKIELGRDVAERRALRLSLAQLHDEKLGEAHEAVLQLRSVLDESPSDVEALLRLDAIYTRETQHAELLEVLDMRAGVAPGPAERDALAFRAAQLVEHELSDASGAIGRYRDILTRSPQHREARESLWTLARGEDYRAQAVAALEPVLRADKDWGGLVELLELRIGSEDATGARLELLGELARIEEQERHDAVRAFAAWARAFAEEPNEPGVRDALERLAAATGDFAGLAHAYEDRLEASFDAGLQRSLAVRLAELHEEKLGSPERAADFLRKALEMVGEEGPVLAALERVLRKLGSFAELNDVLIREAETAVDPNDQAEFWAALGYNRMRQLNEPEAALAAFREAVDRVPEHPASLAALRELLEVEGAREGALDVLEPLAEHRGDFQELVSLYERRLALQEDRSERARWLRRVAEVCEQRMGQPQRALEALGRALKEEPSLGQTVDDMERIALAAGMPGDAAQRIAAVLDAADAVAMRELALKAGQLYDRTQDRTAAERMYLMVLDQDSENTDAMQALEAIYRASMDGEKLCSILERRAGIELDPSARRGLLAEAAGLRERAGAMDRAIEDWQSVRRETDGDAQALSELARLFEGLGRVSDLCEVLDERARFAEDGATRAALFGRIGELKAGQGDLDGAADAFREALDGAPEDPRLLAALEQVQEKRGDYATLQEVLLRRLSATVGAAQVEVLFKLARNAEQKLDDREQAVGFLHQALGVDATNRGALAELERILTVQERWYDLIDVLGRHADVEASGGSAETELKLRVAIADVWEQKMGSPDSAAEALEKVLERAPNNVPALLSLARLHESSERLDDAVAALQRASATARDPEEIADIQFHTGALMEKQGAAAADVEAAYGRALKANPKHRGALGAAEKAARDRNDATRLAEVLELRLTVAADDAERKVVLKELASLYRGPLQMPAAAVSYVQRLAALAPEDLALQEDLADVLASAGKLDESAQVLAELIERLSKARRNKETARFQQRLGALCEKKGDLAGAAQRFNAAYQVDPSHAGTLAALGRLSLQQNDIEKARRYYRSLLLQNFDPAAAGITKGEIYLALGRTHLQTNEPLKARNMFERGLESDPKNEELKQLLAQTPKS